MIAQPSCAILVYRLVRKHPPSCPQNAFTIKNCSHFGSENTRLRKTRIKVEDITVKLLLLHEVYLRYFEVSKVTVCFKDEVKIKKLGEIPHLAVIWKMACPSSSMPRTLFAPLYIIHLLQKIIIYSGVFGTENTRFRKQG